MKCIAVVRFKPKASPTPEQYRAGLEAVMPTYENAAGLNRKYFAANENGGAGIYEWQSREQAEDFYDDAWRAGMSGMADNLTVELLQVNALLDNEAGTVDFQT